MDVTQGLAAASEAGTLLTPKINDDCPGLRVPPSASGAENPERETQSGAASDMLPVLESAPKINLSEPAKDIRGMFTPAVPEMEESCVCDGRNSTIFTKK